MALTQISTAGVKDDAVTAGKIPANAVGSSELADNAVDTAAIADQAVTLDKLPHGTSSNNGKFLRANNGADPSFETVTSTTINNNADNRVITGSGTANTLNAESNVFIESNGRLGIGTSSPAYPLHVNSGTANSVSRFESTDAGVELEFKDSTGTSFLECQNDFRFKDSSGEKVRIDSSGVTVKGATNAAARLLLQNTTSVRTNYIGLSADDDRIVIAADDANQGSNSTIDFKVDGSERMRIDSSGNVGIGNDASFPVYTHANARNFIIGHGGESTALQLHSGTSNYGGIYFGDVADRTDSNSYIGGIEYKHQDNWMNIRVNGSERMRVHSTGQVSIGHNSFTSQTHPAKLVVHPNIHDSSTQAIGILVDGDSGTGGGASQPSIGIKCVNTNTWNNATHQYGIYNDVGQQYTSSNTGIYNRTTGLYGTTKASYIELNKNLNAYTNGICLNMNLKPTGSGGTAYFVEAMKDDSHLKWRVLQNGNLQNANNSYGSTSDVKLKENIVDAKSQWNDIKALKIRNFNFKDDPDKVKMLGVVAQEAEAVSAGLVESENDIEMDEATGKGKIIGTTKFVKYSILYMKAVKALQEAMTKIEVLETKVAALEAA